MTVSKERIAEIRAAWAADRQTARQEFKRDWLMHLVQISAQVGLGVILGLSAVLYIVQRYS
ncbi:hypothetical protein [Comamonas sp. lk]|uniref:hypothetical protein n=1 Tax=Comamonas sp. lk TaxID=2201272 RepID=UPI000EABF367|nr:hypothetical protein [Comamonas sp. lk]